MGAGGTSSCGGKQSSLRVLALHLCVPSWSVPLSSTPTSLCPAQGILFLLRAHYFHQTLSPKFDRFELLAFQRLSRTSLLFYHCLPPQWPAHSNEYRSKDSKKCQQFWSNNIDISGKIQDTATLKIFTLTGFLKSQNDIEIELHLIFYLLLLQFIPILKVNKINYLTYKLSDIFLHIHTFFFHIGVWTRSPPTCCDSKIHSPTESSTDKVVFFMEKYFH